VVETVTPTSRLPIIGGYGGSISTSQGRGVRRQTAFEGVAEGLPTPRQTLLPRRRRVVDSVYSDDTCGLLVRGPVQTIGRCSVLGQVRGSSCVSGTRDTTSDDSSATVLGKAASLQVGRIGHDRQHCQCKQPDCVWIQALRPRGAVLVRPSIVLEEEVVIAVQRSCGTQGKAQALLKTVVLTQPQRPDNKKCKTQGSRTTALGRVQGEAAVFSLRNAAPCCN
jgi:hypothetical protein